MRGARVDVGGEQGLALIMMLLVMTVTSLALVAVLTATSGEVWLSRNDLDQRKAYNAAQAALSLYEYHLTQDVNYWTHCYSSTNVAVPGSSDERYSITPLVASTAPAGTTQCSAADPIGSMIEAGGQASGTFRVRFTGISRNVQRSIVVTFRRQASSTTSTTASTRRSTRAPTRTPRSTPSARPPSARARPAARRSTSPPAIASTARCTARTRSRSAARRSSDARRAT